jgi:hypothetical protein
MEANIISNTSSCNVKLTTIEKKTDKKLAFLKQCLMFSFKGECHEIFDLRFSIFSQAPDYSTSAVSTAPFPTALIFIARLLL